MTRCPHCNGMIDLVAAPPPTATVVSAGPTVRPRVLPPREAALSPREIEVLTLAARGNPNKGIARALGLDENTVKNHLTKILRKLGERDRTGAVVAALARGYLTLDGEAA